MFKYFETNKMNVLVDGVTIENADVVVCLSSTKTVGNIIVPEAYVDINILGKMYDPSTQEFYDCEIIVEEPTVDPELEQAIIDAYTLELIESGVL